VWREQGRRDSPNPIRELFDAAARGYNLKLTCRGCRRAEVLNVHAVWHLFQRRSWREWLREVPARFRCRDCGRKAPELDLVHEGATSNELPMPTEQDWKRELRRRR
jgi:hypothetical protein